MKDLTEGKESRLIFQFALPMLLGNVFQQLYNIVDSIIVGNTLGKNALAAVGASFPIIFMVISLIVGIASGSTVIIAQFYGAKNIEKVKRAIDTMYISLFVGALIVGSLGVLFARKIFLLIGLPDELLPQATIYLRIYLSGILVFFGFNGTSSVLRGMGDSRTPLYFLIGSTLFNIGLDLLFILGLGMGIGGAALATIISQGGAFITMIIYLNKRHEVIRFRLKHLIFDRDLFIKSLRIGLPTGLQQTFVALGMMALLGIVNTFGTNVVAAYSVATRIDSIAMLPAMIFGQALATFVGQNLGANKSHRVRSGLLATFGMSALVSIAVSIGVISLRNFLMGLFTDDKQVIAIGAEYLTIVSAFYLLMSALFTISGVMRGAGDTLIPMFISLFALWVIRVPVAYYLSSKIGETGIWWAVPVAWTFGVIASFLYYRTGRWKSKVVVRHNSP